MCLGLVEGPEGAFQGVVIGDGQNGKTATGSFLNHHPWRVEAVGKVSVDVAVGGSHILRES
jgi:hypothetical protein